MSTRGVVGSLAGAAGAALAWGHFEAGWVRLRTLDAPVRGLPPELEGLRVAHLSDFHLGVPSRGARAVRLGVEWAAGRDPDLVVATGDLVSRPGGERFLVALRDRLGRFGLLLHPDKTRLLEFGRYAAERRQRRRDAAAVAQRSFRESPQLSAVAHTFCQSAAPC